MQSHISTNCQSEPARTVGIIPARYASTRFPGKPLELLGNHPMIQWTYTKSAMSQKLDIVVVATDDQRIFDCVKGFGGNVVMTGNCATGSDRCYQAINTLANNHPDQINPEFVVNIQGDEPLVNPDHIDKLVDAVKTNKTFAALASSIKTEYDVRSLATTKVVMDKNDRALYFSRAMIPHSKSGEYNPEITYYKNCGMYGYSLETLKMFAEHPKTPLQIEEDLEQLKMLELGQPVQMAKVDYAELGVDLPEHLVKLNQRLENKEIQL